MRTAKAKAPWQPTIVREDGLYRVESETDPATFHDVDVQQQTCTCPGFSYRRTCKHITAAMMHNSLAAAEEKAMILPDQEELFIQLQQAADRLTIWQKKAKDRNCPIIERELDFIKLNLANAIDIQRRALRDDTLSQSALADAAMPFRAI